MTNDKPTGWGGGADAELAPLMRLVDLVLIYLALWLPTYARGEEWTQRSWIAATIAAVLFLVIGQSLNVYQSARGARLRAQIVRIWGGWIAGVMHLVTHAFFKSLLFMCSGSVIHAMGGEQDMRMMGGLRKKIPKTFWTMAAGSGRIVADLVAGRSPDIDLEGMTLR